MKSIWRVTYSKSDAAYHVHTPSGNIWMSCPTLRGAMWAMYQAYKCGEPCDYDVAVGLVRGASRQSMRTRICSLWTMRQNGVALPELPNKRIGKPR